jgi:uncharacterized protein YhaN
MPRIVVAVFFLCLPMLANAELETQVALLPEAQMEQFEAEVELLEQPLYSPFIERYVLDELKQLRTDMAAQRNEMI